MSLCFIFMLLIMKFVRERNTKKSKILVGDYLTATIPFLIKSVTQKCHTYLSKPKQPLKTRDSTIFIHYGTILTVSAAGSNSKQQLPPWPSDVLTYLILFLTNLILIN